MKISKYIAVAFLGSIAVSSFAGDYTAPKEIVTEHQTSGWDSHRPDSHAPIGVMGDHTHEKGEVMLSYRYMYMDMRPNHIGSNEVTPQQSLAAGFLIAPTNMRTESHMVGAMIGATDDLTLGFMLPHIDKSMDHLVANGTTFNTQLSGIGDFKFGGLLDIWEKGTQKAHLNLMISAPTGSITDTDFVPPAGGRVRLPYPMQLGSGSWDLLPGITYLGQQGDFSWGAQLLGTIRLEDNDQGYQFGNEVTANSWVAYRLSDSLSTSLRVTGKSWGDIEGSDPRIGGPVPTARPDLRAGSRLDVFGGVNYYFRNGFFEGHRLAVEAGRSVYQDLDGPQLGMDWMMTVGWQKAF